LERTTLNSYAVRRRSNHRMNRLSTEEEEFFRSEQALHERKYLAGTNPRQQSGFGRDEHDWKRFRRPIADAVHKNGCFLDVGCANGLLMESVVTWSREDGHILEPYGLDISEGLADLARSRLPAWRDRVFVGNALVWTPPMQFDFVRTEMVYVPMARRREYIERLLNSFVAEGGRLIVCSYGSSRPEGQRSEALTDDFAAWGLTIAGVFDAQSDHGFITTRAVALTSSTANAESPNPSSQRTITER
jgi:SAM-dependent methyltransferase